jgi:hypothetical protein
MWEKMKPFIEGKRGISRLRALEWFEYLYDEMKKGEQKL